MIKIRLMRIGAKQKPFYRIVVVDERSKRTGAYIELLGTYNPLTEPKDIRLKQDRIDYWIKQGAQPSTGYLRMIGKAPQRPPRKPKKSVQATEDSGQTKTEETKVPENSDKKEPDSVGTESQKDSKSQQIRESEDQNVETSNSAEAPISADTPTTPSPSEPSEKKESEK